MIWLCLILIACVFVMVVVGSLLDPTHCCDLTDEDKEWLTFENEDDEYYR